MNSYDRIMVHHPAFNLNGGSGVSYSDIKGKRIWMNGGFSWRLAAHEIGHSYGCWHANTWLVTDGNPVSPPQPVGTGTPDPRGYSDWFDIMGGNVYANSTDAAAIDFNEQYEHQLGWIPNRVNTLTSGNYYNLKIYRCDDPNALASSSKAGYFAVKFSKDNTYDYWLGYRTNFSNATPGVYVKWAKKTNPESYLIDWVPSTTAPNSGGYLDAALPVGSTLYDRGIWVVKTVAVGQDADGDQWVKVNIKMP